MHEHGGANLRADPKLANELSWAGFDMLSLANNHSGDYGPVGMQLTKEHVENTGLIASGVGSSLREARKPAFYETPKGRVALISAASTFSSHSRAGNTRGYIPAHPGLNPLRHNKIFVVDEREFVVLKQMANNMHPLDYLKAEMLGLDDFSKSFENDVWFLGNRFVKGKQFAVKTDPYEVDMQEISDVVCGK